MTKTTSQLSQLKFWIPGRVVPKARPRFAGGRTLLPANYRCWRRMAEVEIFKQSNQLVLPVKRATVEVRLVGHKIGDADNILGSCLDALVAAGVLLDDRLSCVPEIYLKAIDGKPVGAEIIIKPIAARK